MHRKPITSIVALLAGILFAAGATRADMPAREYYKADLDAILVAADPFPSPDIAAFETDLRKALTGGGTKETGGDSRLRPVEGDRLFAAFVALIKPALERGEIQKVRGFLKAVGDGGWIQGRLEARNGGDFVTRLEVVSDEGGMYLFRQSNVALKPGDWKGSTFTRPLDVAVKKGGAPGPARGDDTPAKPAPRGMAAPPQTGTPAGGQKRDSLAMPSSKGFYRLPDDLSLELVPAGEATPSPSGEMAFLGKVRVLIGQPTEMSVDFLSSPDLVVEPVKVPVPATATGSERAFEVKVRPGKGAATENPWVKMVVTYRPDIAALSAAVSAELKDHPNEQLRKGVLKSIGEQKDPAKRATLYTFSEPPFAAPKPAEPQK